MTTRISSQDDVTDFIFTDDLDQALHHFLGVLVVRVSHTALIAGLRPSTYFYSMNFLAFHLIGVNDLAEETENKKCAPSLCRAAPRRTAGIDRQGGPDDTDEAGCIHRRGSR